jgi:hypothetical protein
VAGYTQGKAMGCNLWLGTHARARTHAGADLVMPDLHCLPRMLPELISQPGIVKVRACVTGLPGLCRAVLRCAVMRCAVLRCAVLRCAVMRCAVMLPCCAALRCAALRCAVLRCAALCRAVLRCAALCRAALSCDALCRAVPCCPNPTPRATHRRRCGRGTRPSTAWCT